MRLRRGTVPLHACQADVSIRYFMCLLKRVCPYLELPSGANPAIGRHWGAFTPSWGVSLREILKVGNVKQRMPDRRLKSSHSMLV